MALGAGLLLRHRPWGYPLFGALLVMLAIECVSIRVDQWFGHGADPASTVAWNALTPVFAVLTAITIGSSRCSSGGRLDRARSRRRSPADGRGPLIVTLASVELIEPPRLTASATAQGS